ncbi:hypothetical protein [Thiorhodococcus minor]|uniref:FkbM family methyltransferase n=1 Tax=Thiorhodococcus minor TaxID=57489 RepID=A0A6M0JUC9_9GAMM|nr:hypothetical protein [Thiorhodococcus minor]NEV61132.1 hypothetical protein [Thiorhodococcus minor]
MFIPDSANLALGDLDTLIHLGAGRCHELDAHLALHPKRLILIEADPETCEQLQARTAEHPHAEVINAAVAGQAGPVTLHRYNLPDANSLHPAEGLLKLFPGLKLREQLPTEALEPSTLLGPLGLDADREHLLVIDLPGEEMPVLEALLRSRDLRRFHHIHLYCGIEPLYQSSHSAEPVLEWLQAQCFSLIAKEDRQDPDQPCWILRLDQAKLQIRELQREIQAIKADNEARAKDQVALKSARDEQVKLVAERQKQLEKLAAERDSLIKEQAALKSARDEQGKLATERQKQLEKLVAERDSLVKEQAALKSARDEQGKLAAERQKQLEALGADKETLIKERAALQSARDEQASLAAEQLKQQTSAREQVEAKLEELTKTLEAAKAEADKHAKLAAQHKTEVDTQAKLAAERAEQLDRAEQAQSMLQRDNAIALRMQALRAADLKDLQQRHAEVVEQKDKQAMLLKQLTERLTVASSYLHQLEHMGESAGDKAGRQSESRVAITAQGAASPAVPATDRHHGTQAAAYTASTSAAPAGEAEHGQP